MIIINVDDNPIKQRRIVRALKELGPDNEVIEFRYAEEVVDYVKKNYIDLIVTDMQFCFSKDSAEDNECGKKLINEIRRLDDSIRFVICTSGDESVDGRGIGHVTYSDAENFDKRLQNAIRTLRR